MIFGNCQVVPGLQVHPHLGRRAKIAAEPEGGIAGDASLAIHDSINAVCGYAKRYSQAAYRKPRLLKNGSRFC
jgi:hypothetical protein